MSSRKYEIFVTDGPRLTRILDLEKTVLHEIQVSGTALWSPTNTNSPNSHIHKPKTVVVEILLVVFA